MTSNLELVDQLLQAYNQGQIDLANVPALKELVHQQVANQLASDDYQKQKQQNLDKALTEAQQAVNQFLTKKQQEIDPTELKQALMQTLNERQDLIQQQETNLNALCDRVNAAEQRLRPWRNLADNSIEFLGIALPYLLVFGMLWHLFMR